MNEKQNKNLKKKLQENLLFLSLVYINNSIQFFIISVLHQQPEGQLQMQHKG
jgi:hypothetical protein